MAGRALHMPLIVLFPRLSTSILFGFGFGPRGSAAARLKPQVAEKVHERKTETARICQGIRRLFEGMGIDHRRVPRGADEGALVSKGARRSPSRIIEVRQGTGELRSVLLE
jgi:hypothetical protein